MSNNWYQQQPNINNQAIEQNGPPRTGNMLRGYRRNQLEQQQNNNHQNVEQYSPAPAPMSQPLPPGQPFPTAYVPNPYSPMPQMPPQGQYPRTQGLRNSQSEQGVQQLPFPQQGFIGNAAQMVRSWSGKMLAARNVVQQPVPPPMVRYRNTDPTVPAQPKPKRWKRSRTLRVSMQMRHRRARWSRNQPGGGRLGTKIGIAVLVFFVVLISSAGGYGFAYYQSQLPRLQSIANQQISQTTHIYDRNGVPLYDSYDAYGRRTPVSYAQIPKVMQDAMIAAEDHTFWTNSGVDPQGILRAATDYSKSGAVQGGGSTITQQLIKKLTNNDKVTLDRKLPEAALAIGLTQQFPKWKILEMYLNIAPFGSQDLGIEAAAEDYFKLNRSCDSAFKCTPGIVHLEYNSKGQKDPAIALARASLLAGMPQNPVEYDPTFKANLPAAYQRQDYVLRQMQSLNMTVDGVPITESLIQQAESVTKKMTFTPYKHTKKAPHFVDWVVSQLETQLGVNTFLTGGFNIYTTIDSNLENYVEQAIKRHLQQPEYQIFPVGHTAQLNVDNNVNDSAAVVMDAKTGEVLAMDGSVDYNSAKKDEGGEYNAALAYRQPGSTWKPIVYATAFQMGWYPGMVLPDVKTSFPTGAGVSAESGYTPTDYGNTYKNWRGAQATIRNDIANSLNIPAIKAVEFAGVNNVADTARRFGITALDTDLAGDQAKAIKKGQTPPKTMADDVGASFALGTKEIPLIQMVGAYQVFANNGLRVPPQSILDVYDNMGHHLYHYDRLHPQSIQVISQQISFMITSVLSDEVARAPEFNPDHVLSFWNGPSQYNDPTYPDVAAKTGTTDMFKDNWAIGYTKDLVVGVWSGNATNTPMGYIDAYGNQVGGVVGITGAGPIFHSVIERASGRCPANDAFPYGDGIDCGNYKSPYTISQFTPPPGVVQAPVAAMDGLQGSGVTDWMLEGEQPLQGGIAQALCVPNRDNNNCNGGNGNNGNNNGGGGNGNNNGGGGNGNNNGG